MEKLNIQSSVIPENKPNMTQWFMEFGVSTMVAKKEVKQERHVFDMKKFKATLVPQPKRFTFKNIFRILTKNTTLWN